MCADLSFPSLVLNGVVHEDASLGHMSSHEMAQHQWRYHMSVQNGCTYPLQIIMDEALISIYVVKCYV